MPKPIAFFFVGVPASGKSSFRNEVLDRLENTIVISGDDIVMEMADGEGLDYQAAFEKYADKSKEEILNRVSWAVESGANILWDQTNLTEIDRAEKMRLIGDDYEFIAVSFEVDDDVLEKRLANREKTEGKHIPAEIFASMKAKYERPEFAEGFENIMIVTDTGSFYL